MKYRWEGQDGAGVDPMRRAAARGDGGADAAVGVRPDEGWTMEEISSAPVLRAAGGRGRAMPIAIAILAAVVGFGFAGRLQDDPRSSGMGDAAAAARSAAPTGPEATGVLRPRGSSTLVIVRPVHGDPIGSVVHVELRTEPATPVHTSVVVGDAVLGWANSISNADGIVDAVIHVYAPDAALPAEVRAATASDAGLAASASVVLAGAGPVAVWSTATAVSPSGAGLLVDGSAPLAIGAVTLVALDGDGQAVGTATAPVVVADGRAGSYGGSLLGLGSFRIVIPIPHGSASTVRVLWTDPIDGLHGSVDEPVEARVASAPARAATHVGAEP